MCGDLSLRREGSVWCGDLSFYDGGKYMLDFSF